jgi:hypothetical protein
MAISSFGGKDFATKIPFVSKALLKVKMKLGKILQRPDYKSRFATGILNGFLPCGMVYMALTASLAAGGIWQAPVHVAVWSGDVSVYVYCSFFRKFHHNNFPGKNFKTDSCNDDLFGWIIYSEGFRIGNTLCFAKTRIIAGSTLYRWIPYGSHQLSLILRFNFIINTNHS